MNSEDVSMSSSSSPAPGSLPSDSLSASVVADLNAAAAAVAAAAAEQHQQHQQLLQSVVGGDGSTGGIPLVGGGNGGAGGGTRKKSQGKDALGEEAQALKVRTENRERKKRWREQNEDRNKDNDLRCRVTKRANKLHGAAASAVKTAWIEEEFEKRRQKRKQKERRRDPNGAGDSEEPEAVPLAGSSRGNRLLSGTHSLEEQLALQQLEEHQHKQELLQQNPLLSHFKGSLQHQQQQHPHHHHQQQHHHHPTTLDFDQEAVKTALALNEFVKKSANHIDLAQLTGVLTDPDLTRQLMEIEAQNSQHVPTSAITASTAMALNATKTPPELELKNQHAMDPDYPMDAVLTLMQLNGSWKA